MTDVLLGPLARGDRGPAGLYPYVEWAPGLHPKFSVVKHGGQIIWLSLKATLAEPSDNAPLDWMRWIDASIADAAVSAAERAAADREAMAQDRQAVHEDRIAVADDRRQTGLDRSAVETAAGAAAASLAAMAPGAANGTAQLDGAGHVPQGQLSAAVILALLNSVVAGLPSAAPQGGGLWNNGGVLCIAPPLV